MGSKKKKKNVTLAPLSARLEAEDKDEDDAKVEGEPYEFSSVIEIKRSGRGISRGMVPPQNKSYV